jgi:hypothetical protein
MSIRDDIIEVVEANGDDEILFLDGLDDAIAGVTGANGVLIVIYKVTSIIKILMNRDEMSYEDAWEYFKHNIGCAYLGEKTPLFMEDFQD